MVGLQLKAGYTGSNPVADEVYHAMSRCIMWCSADHVAQLVEHQPRRLRVLGSSPSMYFSAVLQHHDVLSTKKRRVRWKQTGAQSLRSLSSGYPIAIS